MKEWMLKQIRDAFDRNPEMSLMSSLEGLAQAESEWKLTETTWSIEEILYHVASVKIYYGNQGFPGRMEPDEKPFGDIAAMVDLNRRAHAFLADCLRGCSEGDLAKPIPTRNHGETAANFFWIMAMHDVNHGAQIKTIRRAYGSYTDFNVINR